MATSTVFADATLAALTPQIGGVSLHTADPGGGGLNEVTLAPYSRAAVTWGTPSGATVSNSVGISIPLPAGVAVYYAGLWSALVGGDFMGSVPLQTPYGVGVVLSQGGSVVFPVGSLVMTVGSV